MERKKKIFMEIHSKRKEKIYTSNTSTNNRYHPTKVRTGERVLLVIVLEREVF